MLIKTIKLTSIILVAFVLMACSEKMQKQSHEHKERMERLRHTHQMETLAKEHSQDMAAKAANNKRIKFILYFLGPLGIIGVGVYCYFTKEAGIALRTIDKEEAIERDRIKYDAVVKAIQMLPASEQERLIEKWLDGNAPSRIG